MGTISTTSQHFAIKNKYEIHLINKYFHRSKDSTYNKCRRHISSFYAVPINSGQVIIVVAKKDDLENIVIFGFDFGHVRLDHYYPSL